MRKLLLLTIGLLFLFVTGAKGDETWLYTEGNTPSGHNNGDVAYVGATLYQCTNSNGTFSWVERTYTNDSKLDRMIGRYLSDSGIPEAENAYNGNYAIVGGTMWINENGTWVAETPAIETGWDPETQTLSVGTDETKTILELLSEHSVSSENVNKVVFPDGSVWENGVLTAASGDYASLISNLKNAGLSTSSVKLGDIVTVTLDSNGNVTKTTITTTEEGMLGQNLDSSTNLNAVEKQAIADATNLELVGPFSANDISGIGSKCVAPNRLDLSRAILASDAELPQRDGWKGANGVNGLQTLIFPTSDRFTTIPADFCKGYQGLTSIDIPSQVTIIGPEAFKDCSNLTTVNWGENCSVETIGNGAFQSTDITGSLTIPASVKTIGEKAFRDNKHLEKLYIPANSALERIEKEAFFYDGKPSEHPDAPGLKEVHVECNKFIWCAVDAFDDSHTNGHSDTGTATARLFYPDPQEGYVGDSEGSTAFNDYVGDWKADYFEGGVMNQANLDALKTVVNSGKVKGDTHYGPYDGHGWYMFTSSGIQFTDETTWRTYSDVVNIEVPDPSVIKVYLACGYSNGQVELVQMNKGETIPANTGVLINYVKSENDDFSSTVSFKSVSGSYNRYDDELFPDNKYEKDGTAYKNYLRKINDETVTIYNVEQDANGKKTYRNFFFGNAEQLEAADPKWRSENWETGAVQGWAFFRSGKNGDGTYNFTVNHKAYLHIPVSISSAKDGYGTNDSVLNSDPVGSAKYCGMLVISGETTGLKMVPVEALGMDSESYYTLQGTKVATPSKGIYIYHGKKIIVK